MIGLDASTVPLISAKEDIGIEEVLRQVVENCRLLRDKDAPLQALIFDSQYDTYRGVIVHVNIRQGQVKTGDEILMMNTGKSFIVTEVGYFHPGSFMESDKLIAGMSAILLPASKMSATQL